MPAPLTIRDLMDQGLGRIAPTFMSLVKRRFLTGGEIAR